MRAVTTVLASSALGLGGCGSDGADGRPLEHTLVAGGARLTVDEAPSLRLERDGETLLRFGADAFSLGVVAELSDALNYDPYRHYVPDPLYLEPAGFAWLSPASARFVARGAEVVLELAYPGGARAELGARVDADGRFALGFRPLAAPGVAYLRLRARAHATEGFYGLGESFDSVDQRGRVRSMQMEARTEMESADNEAHVPVPLVTGSRGWGLFVGSYHPGAFAVATSDAETVDAAFGLGTAAPDGLAFWLFAEPHPLDLMRHFYELAGWPLLPARWALGPWVWRNENDDQAQVERDLETMRDLDLAATGYWIDRPYATAVNSFDWEAARFPDPEGMLARARALGYRAAIWHTPYLEDHPATAALRAEAESKGYYPPVSGVPLNKWGTPLDLTNPDAVAFWRAALAAYVAMGIEGFKLDYGEDVLVGPTEARIPWRFFDGSDERTGHALYQKHYHDTYAALLPEDGGFLLCRASTFGDRARSVIVWPGDLDASFAAHGDPVEGKPGVLHVGGLPASVVAGTSLSASGFPFFGADTGGYRHSPPDKETFMRWFEQTAASTVMQIGTGSSDVAWEPTPENGFDAEVLERYRFYVRLHLRLWPFLWTYAERMRLDGRPIQRALGLAHPELGVHPSDSYLLGEELLVAPVVVRGARTRSIDLPAGDWVHWLTGERWSGPATVVVDAPLGRLPLLLSANGLVPMLRPTIDTLAPTTEPARVDSYATTPGLLWVRGVARGDGAFVLFDGGKVEQRPTADGGTRLGYAGGNELSLGVVFELVRSGRPAGVTRDGAPLAEVADEAALEAAREGWRHDPDAGDGGGSLWVKLRGASASADIAH
jgi:alpha-D-xyloside xylohydrolase